MPEAIIEAPKPSITSGAPQPSKSASPNPAPKPSPSPEPPTETGDEGNPFFEVEDRLGMAPPKDAPKPSDLAQDSEEHEEGTEQPEKKEDAKKPDPKANGRDDKAKLKPKSEGGQLREKLETATREVESYKKRISELEARVADTKPSEEVQAVTKRLAEIEKQRDEALSEVAMYKQEATPEFKKQWEEPFNREYKRALGLVKQLPVADPNGQQRAGTEQDLAGIYHLPFAEANAKARELFGDFATNIMTHYTNLHGLNSDYQEALDGERKRWKETSAQRIAEEAKRREGWVAAVTTAKEQLEKNPKFSAHFAYDENDADAKGLVEKGRRLWATIPQEPEKQAMRMASIELAVTHYPRVVSERNKLRAERDSLAAKLKEYEDSEPGTTKRKSQDPSPVDDEAEDRRRFMATR